MKNNSILWLKKIFSVSTLSTLVAIISLIIAIKTYTSGKSGDLVIKVNSEETELKMTDYSGIAQMYLVDYKDTCINLRSSKLHLPIIKNCTNRTVRNLTYEVFVTHCEDGLLFPIGDFIEKEGNVYSYKYDKLGPYESIRFPFETFFTFKLPNRIDYGYKITYEGINGKFLRFVTLHFYPKNGDDFQFNKGYIQLRNEFVEWYLGSYVKENPDHNADNFILTVGDTTIINPDAYNAFDNEYHLNINSLDDLQDVKDINWALVLSSSLSLLFLVVFVRAFFTKKLYIKDNLYSYVGIRKDNQKRYSITLESIFSICFIVLIIVVIMFNVYVWVFHPSMVLYSRF